MKKLALIFKLIELIFIKYDDYVSFTFTRGTNGENGYERWNIYTPVIGHNTFNDKEELISFLQDITERPILYETHTKALLTKNLKTLKEEMADVRAELKKINNPKRRG